MIQVDLDLLDEMNQLNEQQLHQTEELVNFVLKNELGETEEEVIELSITFVDNVRIQELNKQYRNKDYATDVLSFALEEMDEDETEIHGEGIPRVLGDIIISLDKMKEQAMEYNHSEDRELGFLVVHGILHLLGYDHETDEDEKEMFTKQKEYLQQYGLKR